MCGWLLLKSITGTVKFCRRAKPKSLTNVIALKAADCLSFLSCQSQFDQETIWGHSAIVVLSNSWRKWTGHCLPAAGVKSQHHKGCRCFWSYRGGSWQHAPDCMVSWGCRRCNAVIECDCGFISLITTEQRPLFPSSCCKLTFGFLSAVCLKKQTVT